MGATGGTPGLRAQPLMTLGRLLAATHLEFSHTFVLSSPHPPGVLPQKAGITCLTAKTPRLVRHSQQQGQDLSCSPTNPSPPEYTKSPGPRDNHHAWEVFKRKWLYKDSSSLGKFQGLAQVRGSGTLPAPGPASVGDPGGGTWGRQRAPGNSGFQVTTGRG